MAIRKENVSTAEPLKLRPSKWAATRSDISQQVSPPDAADQLVKSVSIVNGKRPGSALAAGPEKPRRRGDDVRERVLIAARHCFGTLGFAGTSTRAVAARAKVTHTLVLYHFQNKDQLWISTLENACAPYMQSVGELFKSAPTMSAAEALKKFIEMYVRVSVELPEVHSILASEGNVKSERLNWVIKHHTQGHFREVCDLIQRGQSEGSVRRSDPARLYYLIMSVGGTLPTMSIEYRELTGRDVKSESEIFYNIAFLCELIFR